VAKTGIGWEIVGANSGRAGGKTGANSGRAGA
jgi:hypothetical protein